MTIHQTNIFDIKTPSQIIEEGEDIGRNATANPTMGDIINRRFSRRGFLGGSLAVAAIATTVSPIALMLADEAKAEAVSTFNFDEIEAGVDAKHYVAPGYDADVFIGSNSGASAKTLSPQRINTSAS